MANYASQADVEGVLGRALSSSEAAALPLLLNAVDEYINDQCNTNFGAPVEATRYYDVDKLEPSRILDVDAFSTKVYEGEGDSRALVAKSFKVEYVDADENVVQLVDSSDYEARPRNEIVKTWLERRSTVWGRGCPSTVANIAVTAFYGFPEVPADIKYAAAYLASGAIGSTQSLSLKSESIEGYSRTFADTTKSTSMLTSTFSKYNTVIL